MARPEIYPWQEGEWRELGALLEAERMPHALMLAGPGEIGKLHLARLLAQRLLCDQPLVGPCGECKNCHLFVTGSHPDVCQVGPEKTDGPIKVDQVRQLGEFAARTAARGYWRVILVEPAEAMNVNAANAFLKTLEEPGEGTVVLLVSHQPGLTLPTIRSRCRIFPLPLPDYDLVARWLETVTGKPPGEQVMTLSGGRPLRARRLLDAELGAQLARFREVLDGVEGRSLSPLEGAKTLQQMPPREVIEWFQYSVYARIRAGEGGERLFRFLDRLTDVRRRLYSTANPNMQLLWEEVLMDWKGVINSPNRPVTG